MNPVRKRIRTDHWIAAILLFAMSAIAFINVVSRYLLHFSFAATEELTINLFVWLTVVGSGIAFERGGQLGMVTLVNLLPRKVRKLVVLFSSLLSASLFVLVNLFLVQAVRDEIVMFHAASGALGIPVWIYYVGVPLLSVYVFRGIYRDALTKLRTLEKEGTR